MRIEDKNNVHNLPILEYRALRYAECEGVIDYDIRNTTMFYIVEYPEEGTAFLVAVDLSTEEVEEESRRYILKD